MGSPCFCGCGREIKGLRRRVTNDGARDWERRARLFPMAIADGLVDDPTGAEMTSLVDRWLARREIVTAFVHGDVSRKEVRSDDSREVHDRGYELEQAVLKDVREEWTGDRPELVFTGVRMPGLIRDVDHTGWEGGRSVRVEVTVEGRPPDGPPLTASQKVWVSEVTIPRIGDQIELALDPARPDDFTFRRVIPSLDDVARPAPSESAPASEDAGDRIAHLRALAELRDAGALTDEEFESEKRKLLG